MRILSLVHGPLVRSELYGDIVRADGHELVERSVGDDPDALVSADGYDAVLVFGGQMNVDEEDEHPSLRATCRCSACASAGSSWRRPPVRTSGPRRRPRAASSGSS